ncbi:hypothetical protein [Magnetococcus sp. PR-3]|uniref:hypothetical protein n=1 Tax=Magnetococcus sp. PR-3 TaxID=3120355 RepID=UPI002FCE2992
MKPSHTSNRHGFDTDNFKTLKSIDSDIYDTFSEIRHDDLFEIGTVRAWCFPPKGAPASVHRAWDMAVNMISDEDADHLAARFFESSTPVGFPLPDSKSDQGNQPHGSYRAWTRRLMAELSCHNHGREDFDEQHALLELFLWALTACEAP